MRIHAPSPLPVALVALSFVASAGLGAGCDRSESQATLTKEERRDLEGRRRLARRIGEERELVPAPGGGVLTSELDKQDTPIGPPPVNETTVGPLGGATDDHRVHYCPVGTSGPLHDLWFVFSDRDVVGGDGCWPGTSSSYLWTVLDPAPEAGCTRGWTGVVTRDFDDAFAGVGAQTADGDLTGYSGVALRVRGDGARVRFEVGFGPQLDQIRRNDCDDDHLDLHGITFTCGDGSAEWSNVRLPFDRFRQQGWGEPFTPTWARVDQVQMRVIDPPLLPDEARTPRHPERVLGGVRTDGFECDFEVVGFLPRAGR